MLETNDLSAINLIKRMMKYENLYCIEIKSGSLRNKRELALFIKMMIKNSFAMISNEYNSKRPIRLMPILGLQKREDKKRVKFDNNFIMKYLKDVTIFLNNSCDLNCNFCSDAFQSFNCCTADNFNPEELPISLIHKIIKEIEFSSMQKLYIAGGNILHYSDFKNLVELLDTVPKTKVFLINILNSQQSINLELLKTIKNAEINYLVSDVRLDKVKKYINKLLQNHKKIKFTFIVKSENELENMSNIVLEMGIQEISELKPYQNERNKDFFEKYVFFSKKKLFMQNLSLKEIYKKMICNNFLFGNIFIKTNGDIYTSLFEKKFGNIADASIREAIHNELNSGFVWTLTRDKIKPCKSCVYCYICPSISNYEINPKDLNSLLQTGCNFN